MIYNILMRAFATAIAVLSAAVLVYVYAFPPPSMKTTRDGVPFFTPSVINPETGKPISVDALVRHYRGD